MTKEFSHIKTMEKKLKRRQGVEGKKKKLKRRQGDEGKQEDQEKRAKSRR
jgi:hypothetical protein